MNKCPGLKIFLTKLKLDRSTGRPKKHSKNCRGNVCSPKLVTIAKPQTM